MYHAQKQRTLEKSRFGGRGGFHLGRGESVMLGGDAWPATASQAQEEAWEWECRRHLHPVREGGW